MSTTEEAAARATAEMISAFKDRLVRRVLDGRVVPFVGAGISMGAKIPGNPDFRPSVGWMEVQLDKELRRRLGDLDDPHLRDQIRVIVDNASMAWMKDQLRDALRDALNRQLNDLNHLHLRDRIPSIIDAVLQTLNKPAKLEQAADLLTWLAGATQLCKVLQINALVQLTPQPAHRFLAYFAREGLITEVITTNYDTCIEQAFQASFGTGLDERSATRASDALAVIFNLAHYRSHAGRNRTDAGDPVLHLYKINGDAGDYQTAVEKYESERDPQRLEKTAARIILTERQLQTFRDEVWARDLYADRTRSRSLLFCGFGSDDAQVRHHTMLLMEEMQRQSHPVNEWRDIPKLPNAPFFAVYERHLTFNQLQVLAGFAMAHAHLGTPVNGAAALKIAYANAFLGSFAEVLEPQLASKDGQKAEPNLPADLFFEKLFQAVWLQRVKEELQSSRVLHGWLRSNVIEHRAWCDWLLERIGATSEVPGKNESNEAIPAIRWALFGIMEKIFARADAPMLFMKWVHAVHTGGESLQQGSDFYLSLREEPLFILLLLLFLVWITGAKAEETHSWSDGIIVEPGLGLRVPARFPGRVERVVYLAREGVRENPSRWSERVPDQVWLIEIPGNEQLMPVHAPPIITDRPVRPVSLLRRTAATIVRAARTPERNPFEILTRVFATTPPQEVP